MAGAGADDPASSAGGARGVVRVDAQTLTAVNPGHGTAGTVAITDDDSFAYEALDKLTEGGRAGTGAPISKALIVHALRKLAGGSAKHQVQLTQLAAYILEDAPQNLDPSTFRQIMMDTWDRLPTDLGGVSHERGHAFPPYGELITDLLSRIPGATVLQRRVVRRIAETQDQRVDLVSRLLRPVYVFVREAVGNLNEREVVQRFWTGPPLTLFDYAMHPRSLTTHFRGFLGNLHGTLERMQFAREDYRESATARDAEGMRVLTEFFRIDGKALSDPDEVVQLAQALAGGLDITERAISEPKAYALVEAVSLGFMAPIVEAGIRGAQIYVEMYRTGRAPLRAYDLMATDVDGICHRFARLTALWMTRIRIDNPRQHVNQVQIALRVNDEIIALGQWFAGVDEHDGELRYSSASGVCPAPPTAPHQMGSAALANSGGLVYNGGGLFPEYT